MFHIQFKKFCNLKPQERVTVWVFLFFPGLLWNLFFNQLYFKYYSKCLFPICVHKCYMIQFCYCFFPVNLFLFFPPLPWRNSVTYSYSEFQKDLIVIAEQGSLVLTTLCQAFSFSSMPKTSREKAYTVLLWKTIVNLIFFNLQMLLYLKSKTQVLKM